MKLEEIDQQVLAAVREGHGTLMELGSNITTKISGNEIARSLVRLKKQKKIRYLKKCDGGRGWTIIEEKS